MKFTIICVGKIKEKYFKDAINEYTKRLSRYVKLEIIELEDEKTPANAGEAIELQIKKMEGERILNAIKENSYVVALSINGKAFSSTDLAKEIDTLAVSGVSHIDFIIGGSLGLCDQVLKRSDQELSFGKMTYPHQLMRVILLEQLYRSQKIIKGETYHK